MAAVVAPRTEMSPRANCPRQDLNNQKFNTKSTFKKKELFHQGVAMSDLSIGTKKHNLP
jgi:hypothetical protein